MTKAIVILLSLSGCSTFDDYKHHMNCIYYAHGSEWCDPVPKDK